MNTSALYAKMRELGLSVTYMYKSLNISRSAFYRKCRGKSEFTLKEITQIMSILGISDPSEIFFNH